MKVNIYQTVQVTDTQRKELQAVLTGSPTRQVASREDIKEFLWQHGAGWATALAAQYAEVPDETPDETPDEGYALEDLL